MVGLVFAAIFIGMAIGMGFGTRPFGDFSRRRLFGVTLTASAVPLALIGLVPNLVVVVVFVLPDGRSCPGSPTRPGSPSSALRSTTTPAGRVFAFFQSTIQVILLAVIAVAPFIATGFTAAIQAITGSSNGDVKIAHITYASAGQNLLLLLSAVLVAFVGIKSYRQLDDRKGVPLLEDLVAAIRNEPFKRGARSRRPPTASSRTGRPGCSSPSRAARARARPRRPG